MIVMDNKVFTDFKLPHRITEQKASYLSSPVHIAGERSRLIRESWEETDGQPVVLRRAKAFKNVLEGIPVIIRDSELIVASQSSYIRGVYPGIEQEKSSKFMEELCSDNIPTSAPNLYGQITEEQKQTLLKDVSYWDGKTPCDRVEDVYHALWGSRCEDFNEAIIWKEPQRDIGGAHSCNWSNLLNLGLKGVIEKARQEIEKLEFYSKDDYQKFNFLQSIILVCEAGENFAHRYAEFARQLASTEQNPVRKAELVKIAEVCDWVPANPARDFWEAIQSFWFGLLMLNLECVTPGQTPGRLDQLLYPWYKKDIETGKLTTEQAWELLCSLWMKCVQMQTYGSRWNRMQTQGSQFLNITLGGVTSDGRDAVNELSFLFLEVIRVFKSHQPHVSVRYHDGLNFQFFLRALEVNRDHGGGIPAFFNDKVALLGLVNKGIPLEEARNWAPQGCVEMTIPDASSLHGAGPFYNLPKLLELTMNNGVDPRTGKQLGPTTGHLGDFKSFSDFYNAFQDQVGAFVDFAVKANNAWQMLRADTWALPFNSALQDGCIESGLDSLSGGARWGKKFLSTIRPFGHVNVVNSLAAIKGLIYEQKKLSWDELQGALEANFEGKQDIHSMLLSMPKWGNDDEEVDQIMIDLFQWTERQIVSHRNPWGEPYTCSRQGVTWHITFGRVVGALPDGRKASDPLADGSLSPMRGTDIKGPTAVLNSAAKVDSTGSDSTLLNLKFHPSSLKTRENVKKLASLVKSYFDRYGYHCQFNFLSRETLVDAKEHPENYRDLVVRVAGFSAYWVELSPQVQDEIIARTEHTII